MQRRRSFVAAGVGLVLIVTGLGACSNKSSSPQDTVEPFVAAWNKGDDPAMADLVDHPSPSFATSLRAVTAGLGATSVTHSAGAVVVTGSTATAPITTSYRLGSTATWTVRSTLDLAKHSGRWLVEWSPAAVYPTLSAGQRLSVTYTWPTRAPILGAAGTPLTTAQTQLTVGVEGSRVTDPAELTGVLEAAGASTGQTSAALALASKHPSYFEPVFEITEARFDQMGGRQSELYTIAGTVFEQTSTRVAVTPGLSAHLVGSVGPITAEELAELGPPYAPGDVVGQTGLEAAYERRLAGSAGATVSVLSSSGGVLSRIDAFQPKPGTPLATGIDPAIQQDAEATLSEVAGEAALVAVKASTGQILASVSDPASDQFDQALEGEFPPGSTFKVLTTTALLEAGLTPSSPASCPPSVTEDGEVFHNAEGDAPVTNLAQAFAESCNTAFVQLATEHLQASDLPAIASAYGIGTAPRMGLDSFPGAVARPADRADLAASSIGQGSIVVSPLAMAMVAASVDTGTVRPARLVVGAPDDPAATASAGSASDPGRRLPSGVVGDLRQLMSSVVTAGTAAGTGLPPDTYAKTGTAQYGSGNPLPTDAWLIGYRADVAFAVVVHDSTGNGGPVDGPIIARFLRGLPAGYQ